MKESSERIQFITEYLISYKEKIEALNKCGLFDAAVLYELFAKEICRLWFEQDFLTLNVSTANFPYVDLISADEHIYVQVSTAKDIPAKVKSTLEKIRDNKVNKKMNIQKLYFFVLGNNSVEKVKDYSGNNRIGEIDFFENKHLITIERIIEKAKENLTFQLGVYNVLYRESNQYPKIEKALAQSIEAGKAIIDTNIVDLINDEYEIDRTKEVQEIKRANNKFVAIQGDAGSGKSALCKKLLRDEENILFARAEQFVEAKTLEDVWGFDINVALEYLNGKRLVIYIDALEFIADGLKSNLDILQTLYETVKKYEGAHVITSCRTSDKAAFAKIEARYKVHSYSVKPLDDIQIIRIAENYDVIRVLWERATYTPLLRIPFYLDLIVSRLQDIEQISDVDGFRNSIWSDIMCLGNKTLPRGLRHSDIRDSIEKITIKRAKEFVVGVPIEDIGEDIVEILRSENIVTCYKENRVRLKYDIFEDICFERIIDRLYDDCKGNYNEFYDGFADLGRCVYRRYQIWVENKLFSKENRDRFLYNIIKTNDVQNNWREQTIIGIVKSDFCKAFFDEYENIIATDLIFEFLKTINLFAFEANILNYSHENVCTYLKPIGQGRNLVIQCLYNKELYLDAEIKPHAIKICLDYSKSRRFDKEVAEAACEILEHYIQEMVNSPNQESGCDISKEINEYLGAVYAMAEYSKLWIKQFWANIKQSYLSGDENKYRLNEEILEYVLKHTQPSLAIHLSTELCEIANAYWIEEPVVEERNYYNYIPRVKSKEYGLSKNADSYHNEFRDVKNNMFINVLVRYNWAKALEWIVSVTNHVAKAVETSFPDNVYGATILLDDLKTYKTYICLPDFWMVGMQDNRVNELIGDSLYVFINWFVDQIKSQINDQETIEATTKLLKKYVIEKSNNIMPLTIIWEIGRRCDEILPEYAIELASSIDLVMLDIQKVAILLPNPERNLLEKQILMTVGLPELPKRYEMDLGRLYTLQDYMIKIQLEGSDDGRSKAYAIIDRLYNSIEDIKENARYLLQIQKMDMRKASLRKLEGNYYTIVPDIKGEAKKLVDVNDTSPYNVENVEFMQIMGQCNTYIANGEFSQGVCLDAIDSLMLLASKSELPFKFQKVIIQLTAYAFSFPELDESRRSQLCDYWIDGIELIFNNETFIFDIMLVKSLFAQNKELIDKEVLSKLKRLALKCIFYKEQNGVIFDIVQQLKKYLTEDEALAQALFNTIVSISEDEMTCFTHCAEQLKEIMPDYKYVPNMSVPPTRYNDLLEEKGYIVYKIREEELVEKFLINEEKKDLSDWDINKCNVSTLCTVSNCGLSLKDSNFNMIYSTMFPFLMHLISNVKRYHSYLDTYDLSDIKSFVEWELTHNDDISDILEIIFDKVDFSKCNYEVYEIYDDFSKAILIMYLDGYCNSIIRQKCANAIRAIEKKILSIKSENVRKRLTSMMFLTLGKFHMTDWNTVNTSYSYSDKMFLNEIWSKYGAEHFKRLLDIVYQLHIKDLLPEVLIPLNVCVNEVKKDLEKYRKIAREKNVIVNMIITKAFLDFNDEIKMDHELTNAYEGVLKALIEIEVEEAAVLLDEFRIH